MADTIPNIKVSAGAVVDLYAVSGLTVGEKISVCMIGNGNAKLYSGAALTTEPNNITGYRPIRSNEELFNDTDDLGAFIWSRQGCLVNVKLAV